MKDQNQYCEALKLYPSSTQEYKVCKHMTLQHASFLFSHVCVCTSSAPWVRAGMRRQLLAFKFFRSLLFLCCLRSSSEIIAGMTLSTDPVRSGHWRRGCYFFDPVTRRAPGSSVSAALSCGVLENSHYHRKTFLPVLTFVIPAFCLALAGCVGHFVVLKLFWGVLESLGHL